MKGRSFIVGLLAVVAALFVTGVFQSRKKLPMPVCRFKAQCLFHAAGSDTLRIEPAVLAAWISSISLIDILEKPELVSHYETIRELDLIGRHDDPKAKDLADLILALYARTFTGHSISDMIAHKRIVPGQIGDNRARAVVLTLAASEQLDRMRFRYSDASDSDSLLKIAQTYATSAAITDTSNPYPQIVLSVICLERYKTHRQTGLVQYDQSAVYLDDGERALEKAFRCVQRYEMPRPVRNVKASNRARDWQADFVDEEKLVTSSQAESLRTAVAHLLLIGNNYLEISDWRALDGKPCTACLAAQAPCGVAAAVLRLASTRKSQIRSASLNVTGEISALEHLSLASEALPDFRGDELRRSTILALNDTYQDIKELPERVRPNYGRAVFEESPFIRSSYLPQTKEFQDYRQEYLSWVRR